MNATLAPVQWDADALLAQLRANVEQNRRERRYAAVYGPLVCECSIPEADPRVDAGMCQRCYRKPLGLMRAAS